MRRIKCSKVHAVLVDDEDYYELYKFFWIIKQGRQTFYAFRKPLGMHYYNWNMSWDIMGRPEKGFVIDHIDGNGLNNQRYNLRQITVRQNNQNKHTQYTSNYVGVSLGRNNQWDAQIRVKGETKRLGTFNTEIEAHEAYKVALKVFNLGELLDNKVTLPPLPKINELDDPDTIIRYMKKDGKSQEEIDEYMRNYNINPDK